MLSMYVDKYIPQEDVQLKRISLEVAQEYWSGTL